MGARLGVGPFGVQLRYDGGRAAPRGVTGVTEHACEPDQALIQQVRLQSSWAHGGQHRNNLDMRARSGLA